MTGKRLAGDPVSGEDSLRVEQLDYFEQVLENSMVTSEERVEQLTRTGMQSDGERERLDTNAAIISPEHRARKDSNKLRAAEYVERNDYVKSDGEVLVEALNASRSVKAMGVNLRVQYDNTMRCDKPSVTNLSVTTFIQEKHYISAGSTLGVSARRRAIDR